MLKNTSAYVCSPAQVAGLVQLLDSVFSVFNPLGSDLDFHFDVRPSGVVHLIGSETCEFTNLPFMFLGVVTPTGVVFDLTGSDIEVR